MKVAKLSSRRRVSLFPTAFVLATAMLGCAPASAAQERQSGGTASEFAVWPGKAPGSESWNRKEIVTGTGNWTTVRNVVRPSLTPFLPKQGTASGTAVVIAPGGAFRFLSWANEGTEVAEWLSERGVAAFVLKYRLVDTGSTDADYQKAMLELSRSMGAPGGPFEHPETKQVSEMAAEDARQAIRVLRRQAAKWGISSHKIGIMGFSAGAVVATRAGTRYDADSRPNFICAVYGAPMRDYAVPTDAPPLYVTFAKDDGIGVQATELQKRWKDAGKTAELIAYERGGHGYGMTKRGQPTDNWIERFAQWLATQGFMKRSSTSTASEEQELQDLSREKWRWMTARDIKALDSLFREDAVFAYRGETLTKAEEMAAIRSGEVIYKYAEILDVSVRTTGNEATVQSKIRLFTIESGMPSSDLTTVSEEYVKEGGRWRLRALTCTEASVRVS